MDNELLLFDRVNVIKDINTKYDLEHNAYISFSGGKDSTILHYLLDLALPNNNIPRVFIDTGIEYNYIREFVKEMAEHDKRIIMLKPTKPITKVLQQYGYPFKSKQHSHDLAVYQHSGMTTTCKKYLGIEKGNNQIKCPNCLKYQFTDEFKIRCSDKCCLKLKKEPIRKWEKENNRTIAILGLRQAEGVQRLSSKGCLIRGGKGIKFKPLNPVSDSWEEWFVKSQNIKLCKLYTEPFNFKRTGCKGCPFALDLQEQLEIMEKYLPNERKQCEIIWKPIYDEYRRLNYRLKKDEQIKLF